MSVPTVQPSKQPHPLGIPKWSKSTTTALLLHMSLLKPWHKPPQLWSSQSLLHQTTVNVPHQVQWRRVPRNREQELPPSPPADSWSAVYAKVSTMTKILTWDHITLLGTKDTISEEALSIYSTPPPTTTTAKEPYIAALIPNLPHMRTVTLPSGTQGGQDGKQFAVRLTIRAS